MSAKPEIERKFLLASEPPGLARARRSPIVQGYLARDPQREIRLRRRGSQCFLTVKDGRGHVRGETEMRLSQAQFEALWPLTASARLVKTRHVLKFENHVFEIDLFEGSLAKLRLVEIEFPSREASADFVKPAFLGEEVTGREEYTNAHLAYHGLPDRHDGTIQAGALPFLFQKGRLHLVLVKNSSGNRWIVPKGQLEAHMSRQDVALMEAAEEAGVVGNIEPGQRAQCRLEDGRHLHLYPLRVSTLLKRWPEAATRKRSVLPFAHALARIQDKALAACIRRLSARIEE